MSASPSATGMTILPPGASCETNAGGGADAIAVHATAPAPPPALVSQLAPGGRMVIPVAEGDADMLTAYVATPSGVRGRVIAPCRFVPLVGEEGFGER